MRILVAGWHGQVAHALSERAAIYDDVSAMAVGRPAVDLSDHTSIGRLLFDIDPHIVVNTAAFTDVDGAEDQPDRAQRENAYGAALLAETAARRGIPIIHLSTAHVFDGERQTPYTEDDQTAPVNSYGRTKLEGEHAVAAANPAHVIIRTGWVYSPFGRNFVTSVLQRARSEDAMQFVSDQTGAPTYAIHLADALLEIANRLVRSPDPVLFGTYHLAGKGSASWYDMADRILQRSTELNGPSAELQPISTNQFPSRSPRPSHACLDCSKANQVFALSLPGWRDGIDDCVRRILS